METKRSKMPDFGNEAFTIPLEEKVDIILASQV